jgi:DNA-binding transcriptional ArsR family regulator
MKKTLSILHAGKNIEILDFLKDGEKTVKEIHAKTKQLQNLCSYHLGKLKDRGFITSRREGTFMFYKRDNKAIKAFLSTLKNI